VPVGILKVRRCVGWGLQLDAILDRNLFLICIELNKTKNNTIPISGVLSAAAEFTSCGSGSVSLITSVKSTTVQSV
jgi:hypothetical protein